MEKSVFYFQMMYRERRGHDRQNYSPSRYSSPILNPKSSCFNFVDIERAKLLMGSSKMSLGGNFKKSLRTL